MKKNAGILLVLLIFFITLGCVVETRKPEVNGNLFKSVDPSVNVRIEPRFKYLGKFEEETLLKRGAAAVVKLETYVFGAVEDNVLKEAVAAVYQTLPDGWKFTPSVPTGSTYMKFGGYKWLVSYRVGTPQYLFGNLGKKVSFSNNMSFSETYAVKEFLYLGRYNKSLTLMYVEKINFFKTERISPFLPMTRGWN